MGLGPRAAGRYRPEIQRGRHRSHDRSDTRRSEPGAGGARASSSTSARARPHGGATCIHHLGPGDCPSEYDDHQEEIEVIEGSSLFTFKLCCLPSPIPG